MKTIKNIPRYSAYKDSGAEWLGEIPEGWDLLKVKYLFKLIIEEAPSNNNFELLSVYTDIGVRPRKELEERGNKASSTDGYWIVKKGDIIVNKLLAWMGAIGVSNYHGVTSPAYDVLRPKQKLDSLFYHLLFRTKKCSSELKKHSRGIMDMRLRLYFDKFGAIKIPCPSYIEQIAIIQFLDIKTSLVDQAIAIKQKQIELLKERQQIIIQQAVTQGLDPNVPMKDSGIEWIGSIPEHWHVMSTKRVATINPIIKVDNKNSNDLICFLPMEKVSSEGEICCDLMKPIREVSQGFTTFARNDVILAKITPCFENGKAAYLNMLTTPFGYGSTEFHVLRSNKFIYGKYLYHIIHSYTFLKIGEAMMTGSAGQKRVPTSFVTSFPIAIPPLKEQKSIINYIDQQNKTCNNIITVYQQQIEKLKEYKATLIDSAVTGKIKITTEE